MKLHYLLGAKCLLSRCLLHFFPWHTAYPAEIHWRGSSLSHLGGCIKSTQQLAVQRGVTVCRNSLHLIRKHTNTSNPSDFECTWSCWVNNPPILAPISHGTWTIQSYPTATPHLPDSSFPSPQALTLTEAHAQWSATYQHGKVSPVLQCVGKSEMSLFDPFLRAASITDSTKHSMATGTTAWPQQNCLQQELPKCLYWANYTLTRK